MEVGENLGLLKYVIRHNRVLETDRVLRLHLFEAFHQKPHLRFERAGLLSLVKASEEGIVLRLNNPPSSKRVSEDFGQRGLSHSDGSLNCDIARRIEQVSHDCLLR